MYFIKKSRECKVRKEEINYEYMTYHYSIEVNRCKTIVII